MRVILTDFLSSLQESKMENDGIKIMDIDFFFHLNIYIRCILKMQNRKNIY